MAKTDKERSQAKRDKQKKLGLKRVEFFVSAKEYETLQTMGKARAGCRKPYSVNEYAVTLLRQVLPLDVAKYEEQTKDLGTCDTCHMVLPGGCNGAFKGQKGCFHTQDSKALELARPIIQHDSGDRVTLKKEDFETLLAVAKLVDRLAMFYPDASQPKKSKSPD